jgi:hypothetical protein
MPNRSVLYEFNVDLASGDWGVACPLDQSLIGPVAYGWDPYLKDRDPMTFGGGLLAGSPLAGTRRMLDSTGDKIERHVPALPLSRDHIRLAELRRSLVVYRMVFGQSRQEDLLAYLLAHVSPERIQSLVESLCIDLSPKVL